MDTLSAAINLRLNLIGQPMVDADDFANDTTVAPLLARQREISRRLSDRLCPTDLRIQTFLDDYFAGAPTTPHLPRRTLVLDQPGLARECPCPATPTSSRRAPAVQLPARQRRPAQPGQRPPHHRGRVPHRRGRAADPRRQDRRRPRRRRPHLRRRVRPAERRAAPALVEQLPHDPAECWVSLLLRPAVQPKVPGFTTARSLEVHFIVPGGLVANLDFVEGIFGNGGDPYLPENDASLDPRHWTGHSGLRRPGAAPDAPDRRSNSACRTSTTATERQQRDGQCWKTEDELYNGGQAFKLCVRDERGVIATVIADNYFGYCKKEVKTQISYSANLLGSAEEEHAGGAIWCSRPTTSARGDRRPHARRLTPSPTPDGARPASASSCSPRATPSTPSGRTSRSCPRRRPSRCAPRPSPGTPTRARGSIQLLADQHYLLPNGYRVHAKHRETDKTAWHLVGTVARRRPTAHKPATVSGGGKSEISKSILDAFVFGNAYVADFEADMDAVAGDHRPRLRPTGSPTRRATGSTARDPQRRAQPGLGHQAADPVERLHRRVQRVARTPRPARQGARLHRQAVLRADLGHPVAQAFRRPDAQRPRRQRPAARRRRDRRQLPARRLRARRLVAPVQPASRLLGGVQGADRGRHHGVHRRAQRLGAVRRPDGRRPVAQGRPELRAAAVPASRRRDPPRLRQADREGHGPAGHLHVELRAADQADARAMVDDVVAFSQFTEPDGRPDRRGGRAAGRRQPGYFVCSANPRLVNGKRSKNPRYLQVRPDLSNPEATASADTAVHLLHKLASAQECPVPVDVVAAGRRNNPAEPGDPAAVHLQPAALHGAARAVHGVHQLDDRASRRPRRARAPRAR